MIYAHYCALLFAAATSLLLFLLLLLRRLIVATASPEIVLPGAISGTVWSIAQVRCPSRCPLKVLSIHYSLLNMTDQTSLLSPFVPSLPVRLFSQISWFIANGKLSLSIAFPLIAAGPG